MTKFDSRIIKVVDEKIKELIPLWLTSGKRDDDVMMLLKRINDAMPLIEDIKTEVKALESRRYPPLPDEREKKEEPKKKDPESLVPAIREAVENGNPTDIITQLLLGYDPTDKQSFSDYLDDQIDDLIDWFKGQGKDAIDTAKGLSWVVQKVTGAMANLLRVLGSDTDRRRIRDNYMLTMSVLNKQVKAGKDIESIDDKVEQILKALIDCCTAINSELANISTKLPPSGTVPRPNTGTETPKRGVPPINVEPAW